MNINFTEKDLEKLNEMILATPFKFAYPIFQFFQGKVNESVKAEQIAQDKAQEVDNGNSESGQ